MNYCCRSRRNPAQQPQRLAEMIVSATRNTTLVLLTLACSAGSMQVTAQPVQCERGIEITSMALPGKEALVSYACGTDFSDRIGVVRNGALYDITIFPEDVTLPHVFAIGESVYALYSLKDECDSSSGCILYVHGPLDSDNEETRPIKIAGYQDLSPQGFDNDMIVLDRKLYTVQHAYRDDGTWAHIVLEIDPERDWEVTRVLEVGGGAYYRLSTCSGNLLLTTVTSFGQGGFNDAIDAAEIEVAAEDLKVVDRHRIGLGDRYASDAVSICTSERIHVFANVSDVQGAPGDLVVYDVHRGREDDDSHASPRAVTANRNYTYRWMRAVRGTSHGSVIVISEYSLFDDSHTATTQLLGVSRSGEVVSVAEYENLWSPASTWADSHAVKMMLVEATNGASEVREVVVPLSLD